MPKREKLPSSQPRKSREPRRGAGWPGRIARWSAIVAIWTVLAVGVLVVWYAWDLPDVNELGGQTRRPSVTLLAADGSVVSTYGDYYAGATQIQDLPPYVMQAVIATEDRRFFEHIGFDPAGIIRAMVVNIRAGGLRQGGSTITQQLAKNLFLSNERTLRRKVQETLLAIWLETKFSKQQIFAIYMNRVYFGAGAWGLEAAARRYFGRPARDLNVREAALIAGLLKAPSKLSPARDRDAAETRASQVIENMVAAGYLNEADAARAEKAPLRLVPGLANVNTRYFADWALAEVVDRVGKPARDLVVSTTLDTHLQEIAESALETVIERDEAKRNVSQGALVALSPHGAVLAMVGGRDYGESQFNRATQARRQPGSAFKPFVYLAALEAGVQPSDTIVDGPINIGGWRPANFDEKFRGTMTVRDAFAYSINTAAVQLSERVGRERVIQVARRLGISTPLQATPALALGASEVTLLDLTTAYATIEDFGRAAMPHAVTEIRDSDGNILYRRSGSGSLQAIDPRIDETLIDMMGSVVAYGTGRAAALNRPAAGKTGTTSDFRDAWFVGFTNDIVAGVWVGNDNSAPMKGVTGGTVPAEIWRKFMVNALVNRPYHPPEMPRTVEVARPPAAIEVRPLPPPSAARGEQRSRFLDQPIRD